MKNQLPGMHVLFPVLVFTHSMIKLFCGLALEKLKNLGGL